MSFFTWLMILTGVGLNAAAQLLLKSATRPMATYTELSGDTLLRSISVLTASAPFWAGMLCYAASLCAWLAALAKAPVSVAYPMLSLGYVVVAGVSALWLGENLTLPKIAGIALICAGVYLVSRSST